MRGAPEQFIALGTTETHSPALKKESLHIAEPAGLRAVNIRELASIDVPPREFVLSPVMPRQGLAMAYAPRGLGKTFFGLSAAYAVASGGSFLSWKAPEPRPVLYVDGEMPLITMKERLFSIARGMESDITDPNFFKIVTPDLQGDISPDISTATGQHQIEALMEDREIVFLDNLSCLSAGGENEADAWLPIQNFLLRLRRKGKSVVLLHHSGKGGVQRGTSRREDVLDTVLNLRRPSDYLPDQGARFEIHFEKARGIYGTDAAPLEAQLEIRNDAAAWAWKPLEDIELKRVMELSLDGMTIRDIAEETGLSKSKVHRLLKKGETND